jgi:hypothetical protein
MQQLIDLTEIAEILHVSPDRADELAKGVVFPPSIGDRGAERLWRRADVEVWARAIGPRAWPPELVASREEVEYLRPQD